VDDIPLETWHWYIDSEKIGVVDFVDGERMRSMCVGRVPVSKNGRFEHTQTFDNIAL
jgi:hypothetical protein